MKTNIAAVGLTVLLTVALGSAQSPKASANIPFEFTAAGKVLPAGQYDFTFDAGQNFVTVRGIDKGPAIFMPVVTLLAGAMHTTPSDSHIVFDKVGNNRYLSELWIPGADGICLIATKEKHAHEIVNVPVPR